MNQMRKGILMSFSICICATLFLCTCADSNGSSALNGWENLIPPEPEPDTPADEPFFKMRGLVMGWNEVSNPYVLDYIKIAKETGINTFSVYGADRSSKLWQDFFAKCQDAGIDIEFEEHMMSFLLPRDLFSTHPEYFRMNENGERVNDANGCPSSKGALEEVFKNAKEIGARYEPTNNKYYFWLDDGGGVCHCPKCKELNDADQALIFENVVIEALKELNPEATLAHLCYANTIDPPKKVKPHKDIFLEFAPFYRSWSYPLKDEWVEGKFNMTHGKYLKSLKEHLKVFPAETAQVLEYWMDDSLFSDWKPDNLVEVPWDNDVFSSDLETYASFGIRNITCYCAYVGPDYVKKFGFPYFLIDYGKGLYEYRK